MRGSAPNHGGAYEGGRGFVEAPPPPKRIRIRDRVREGAWLL